MQCSIISFRNIASDYVDEKINTTIKLLSSKGIFVSVILQISDGKNAFTNVLHDCLNKYDYIFIIDNDTLNFSIADYLNTITESETQFLYSIGNVRVFLLPDKFDLIEDYIKNATRIIKAKQGEYFGKTVLKAFCLDSSIINETILKAKKLGKNQLEIFCNSLNFDFTIEIVYNNQTPKLLIDDILRLINKELFEYIYSLDGNSLSQSLYDILSVRKLILSTAESFTGGGIANKIVENSGASSVFYEGVTAYSNKSKVQRLNVSQTTLNEFGAVSDQTAYEMACGLLETNNCNVAIATTGIAGPNSDNTNKPKGLCFIAIGYNKEIEIYKYFLKGDREEVTKTAINAAMFLTLKKIK